MQTSQPTTPPTTPPAGYVRVEDEQGRLLFLYDPLRDLVEIVHRGQRTLKDLRDYKPGGRLAPVGQNHANVLK